MTHLIFIILSLLLSVAVLLQERKILSPFVILPLLIPGLLFLSPSIAYLIGGMILLIKAADFLIDGAVWIAEEKGVPPLVTGIIIIGLGTSMPELFVNLISAFSGSTDLALGNILGSNLTNMGLVIGVGGMIAGTIKIEKSLISREIPIMLGATFMVILLAWNFFPGQEEISKQALAFNDGLILFLALIFYMLYLFQSLKKNNEPTEVAEMYADHYEASHGEDQEKKSLPPLVLILFGITGLYFGGDFIIKGALELAEHFGAGAMAMGIIVGVGTSLPELAAAVSAARKGETDLIVGNVVGSNIFNLLLVLGSTALVAPIYTGRDLLPHFAILSGVSLFFFILLGTGRRLSRVESGLMTLCGLGYLIYGLI